MQLALLFSWLVFARFATDAVSCPEMLNQTNKPWHSDRPNLPISAGVSFVVFALRSGTARPTAAQIQALDPEI